MSKRTREIAHTCTWEYVTCKDGETFYKCSAPFCQEIKVEFNDTGCGG